jgi:hypothetical protein
MNLFDPPDTSNGYISRQGVTEDHSDPTSTINLAKWVVTAPYTDENEEISPPNKKIRTLTVNYERNFRTATSILRQTLLRPFKIIFPKYFCLNYPREKAIFQTGSLTVGGSSPCTATIFVLLLYTGFTFPKHCRRLRLRRRRRLHRQRHLASVAELGIFRTLWFII